MQTQGVYRGGHELRLEPARGTANAAGRADWFWQAPLDTPPGSYTMLVRGNASGFEQRIPVSVTAGEPGPPVVNVEPNLGPSGTRFACFARNFAANERIAVRLDRGTH